MNPLAVLLALASVALASPQVIVQPGGSLAVVNEGPVSGPATPAFGNLVQTPRGLERIDVEGFSEDLNADGFVDPVVPAVPLAHAAVPAVHAAAVPVAHAAAVPVAHAAVPAVHVAAVTAAHAAVPVAHAAAVPATPILAHAGAYAPAFYSQAPIALADEVAVVPPSARLVEATIDPIPIATLPHPVEVAHPAEPAHPVPVAVLPHHPVAHPVATLPGAAHPVPITTLPHPVAVAEPVHVLPALAEPAVHHEVVHHEVKPVAVAAHHQVVHHDHHDAKPHGYAKSYGYAKNYGYARNYGYAKNYGQAKTYSYSRRHGGYPSRYYSSYNKHRSYHSPSYYKTKGYGYKGSGYAKSYGYGHGYAKSHYARSHGYGKGHGASYYHRKY